MINKQASYSFVWNKYLPAIRILLKKSATDTQLIGMNRIDFERVAGIRKSGYRFVINYIDGKPDAMYSGNDIAQSLISAVQADEVMHDYIQKNNYTLTFNSKYQLQIKNNGASNLVQSPVMSDDETSVN